MNEYERMSQLTWPVNDIIADRENWVEHEFIQEQLFAEYLMEAGLIPEEFLIFNTSSPRYLYNNVSRSYTHHTSLQKGEVFVIPVLGGKSQWGFVQKRYWQ